MDDIVDKAVAWDAARASWRKGYEQAKSEDAAEIEALRSDISRLSKALETIAFAPQGACGPDLAESIAIARAAIRQKSDVPTDVNDMPEGEKP